MELFWILNKEQQAKLISYQLKHYGTYLEVIKKIPPVVIPESTTDIEMTDTELETFMSQPPHNQKRVM